LEINFRIVLFLENPDSGLARRSSSVVMWINPFSSLLHPFSELLSGIHETVHRKFQFSSPAAAASLLSTDPSLVFARFSRPREEERNGWRRQRKQGCHLAKHNSRIKLLNRNRKIARCILNQQRGIVSVLLTQPNIKFARKN
jgi:hypothetical protein